MIVVRLRKRKKVMLRPRCKDCNNKRERGHRREWKRSYLRRWRKWHADLNRSYWTQRNSERRLEINASALRRFQKNHHAILIQGRLRRRLDMHVSLVEAKALLKEYGPCYPTRYGLTPFGVRECERIRSNMCRLGKHLDATEIRIMVYADGHYKKPSIQQVPYQRAAEQLRRWQAGRRKAA